MYAPSSRGTCDRATLGPQPDKPDKGSSPESTSSAQLL